MKIIIVFIIFHMTVDKCFWILKETYIITKRIMNQVSLITSCSLQSNHTQKCRTKKVFVKKSKKLHLHLFKFFLDSLQYDLR